jgi:hypothetical protein
MEGWGDKALPFLAVGRVEDSLTLACYFDSVTDEQKEQVQEVFKKLMQAGEQKLEKGSRIRLQWNNGSVCCFMDQKGILLYCVVTSLITYPERLAYQLLYDLVVSVQALGEQVIETATEHSLNETLAGRMRELVVQYEDSNNFPQFHAARASAGGHSGLGISNPTATSPARNSRTKLVLLLIVIALIVTLVVFVLNMSSQEEQTTTTKPTTAGDPLSGITLI